MGMSKVTLLLLMTLVLAWNGRIEGQDFDSYAASSKGSRRDVNSPKGSKRSVGVGLRGVGLGET